MENRLLWLLVVSHLRAIYSSVGLTTKKFEEKRNTKLLIGSEINRLGNVRSTVKCGVSCAETGGCLAAEYWTNRKECILHSFLNVPIMASQTDDGVNLMLLKTKIQTEIPAPPETTTEIHTTVVGTTTTQTTAAETTEIQTTIEPERSTSAIDCARLGGKSLGSECIWTYTDKNERMTWQKCWDYCKEEENRRMIIIRDAEKHAAVMDYLTDRNNHNKHWISLYDINKDKKSHKYVIDNNNGVFKLENMTSFTKWKDDHPEKNKPCTNLEKKQGWDWASDNCSHKHLCTCEYY